MTGAPSAPAFPMLRADEVVQAGRTGKVSGLAATGGARRTRTTEAVAWG